jgi:hypothetical protein
MRSKRALTAAVMTAAFAPVISSGAWIPVTAGAMGPDRPAGVHLLQPAATSPSHQATPAFSYGSGNLIDHGGSIEARSTNFLIFWGPAEIDAVAGSTCSGALPCDTYASLLSRFFTDIGGSPLYGMLTQYGPSNTSSLGGIYVDPTPYPATSMTLSDADIRNEVTRAETANGWVAGIGHNFFVVTEPGEATCDTFGCSTADFCAYHSTFRNALGQETAYADIPYPENVATSPISAISNTCSTGHEPNLVPGADDAINLVSHELFEMVTDPGVGVGDDGWYDSAGFEVADKCVWMFGALDSSGADVSIDGHPYIVQLEYSNRLSDCTLS